MIFGNVLFWAGQLMILGQAIVRRGGWAALDRALHGTAVPPQVIVPLGQQVCVYCLPRRSRLRTFVNVVCARRAHVCVCMHVCGRARARTRMHVQLQSAEAVADADADGNLQRIGWTLQTAVLTHAHTYTFSSIRWPWASA